MLKLHGVPLSQPFRSVAWLLLQKRLPFAISIAVPGSSSKHGVQSEDFLAKAPLGEIPVLEEPDGTMIYESPAIMRYLAETRGWEDVYPASALPRARVNAFMHWHHNGTRVLAGLFQPIVRSDLGLPTPTETVKRMARATAALQTLDTFWLRDAQFIGGLDAPSIADLLAYEEVVQLLPGYGNLMPDATSLFPTVSKWVTRMQGLPMHDAAHASLASMGDLQAHSDVPMPTRLSAATKAGLKAVAAAQPCAKL